MRYLKYFALLAALMVPLSYSQAQVSVGVGVGVGPGYAGPPVCSYGYYNYYPYACAPYGFYGQNWFVDGFFIGAGPWYHWGHPAYFWNRGYVGRGWDHDGWRRDGYVARGYRGGWGYGHNGYARGYAHNGYGRGDAGRGYRGGEGFHGGGGYRGGQSFHGGGSLHGGGRR